QRATVLVLGLGLAIGTVWQERIWKDDLTLYGRGVDSVPDNIFARTNLADVMFGKGMYDQAIEQYLQVLAKAPAQWHSNYRIGFIFGLLGRHDEAALYLNRAIEIQPANADQHLFLGVSLMEQGRLDDAALSISRSLEIRPDLHNAHYAL